MITDATLAERGARLVRANGIDIAYTEAGDGPPLVLLHGGFVSAGPAWADSPVAYVRHMASIAKHFRVIAPDTRGSGATVHPGGTASYTLLADDVTRSSTHSASTVRCSRGSPTAQPSRQWWRSANPTPSRPWRPMPAMTSSSPMRLIFETGRILFGGSPEATEGDPEAAERALGTMAPMAGPDARRTCGGSTSRNVKPGEPGRCRLRQRSSREARSSRRRRQRGTDRGAHGRGGPARRRIAMARSRRLRLRCRTPGRARR